MFGVAIAAVLGQTYFMSKLSLVSEVQKKSEMLAALKLIYKQTILRVMMVQDFVRGMRDGVFAFFLSIILFEIVSSEALVGFNTFLIGVASIISAWLYGRLVTPRHRAPVVTASVTVLLAFCSVLLFALNPMTIMLFSIVNSFLGQMVINCAMNNSFDIMGRDETARGVLTEVLGYREIFMMGGRIVGIIVVGLFPNNLRGYVYAMLTLTALQYIVAALLFVCCRMTEREASQNPGENYG